MASVIQPTPPPSVATAPRTEERLVDERIHQTRRSLKWVDFGSGLLTLVIGVLVFLLCMSLLEHWVIPGGWNGPMRIVLFALMLLGIAWYSWRAFWPLVSRPINPAYAAQLIERSTPSLKNSLLNFLLLRDRRQQLSQKVYQAIEQQAAQRLSEVSLDSVIDRSALIKLGYLLAAVVAICALYRVLSPKNVTTSMERVLMPWSDTPVPSRVEILSVLPGDTQIARGESLEVTAEVLGLRPDEPVRVRYSTLDGQSVDREFTLNGSEGSSRFQGRLSDRLTSAEGGGVQQDLEYWVEAGDAKSEKFRVLVFARPTLVVEKIRYQFPAYTHLGPREDEGTGDISAIEGTKVSVYALANHEIASASLDFGADGRNDLPMSTEKEKATVQFELALQEDRRTPEHDSYVLQYKTTSGRLSSLPPKYSIDVTPDYAPEVRLLKPVDDEGKLVEQLDVPLDSPFTVEVEARDPDFALKNVVLLGDAAGEQVLKHDLLTQEQSGKFVGQFTATPAELKLKPGDILEYRAAAVDNREPEPNVAETEKLRIRVLGPPDFGKQQGQGQGETPQGGEGGESSEGNQGESGEQGQADGGTDGEKGRESDSAGGEQQGEGQSQGEQQGQGPPGANQSQGESEGKPAPEGGADGNQQDEGAQSGEQGDPNGEGAAGAGDRTNDGQPGEPGEVSSDGSDDGEAFERMNDHFAEKDGEPASEGGGEQQSESAGETQSREGDGESSQSKESTEGETGRNEDQGIEGADESEQTEGSGAEGQPSEQREGEPASAGGEEKEQAPGGKMSSEQGEPGAGNNPGENEGSAETDTSQKPGQKEDKGSDSSLNDEGKGGQTNSQKESDSKGSEEGDQSGGGQEGAGQQADSQGTGTAGENTAADGGAGQSEESGPGENSSQAGKQGESDKPTDESSENQAGEGSKQSGEGAAASGDEGQPQSGDEGHEPGENGDQPPKGSQPSPPTGNPGQGPPSGGTGNNNLSPPAPGEMAPGDEANLDYARKQTDLVLDRLDEQLKNNEVDSELLKKLGWTKEELQRFVDRWKALKAEAEESPNQQNETELDKALRSLGLDPNRRTGFQSQETKEKLRRLQDSYRGQTPLEYADQVRAYIKGTATVPEEKD